MKLSSVTSDRPASTGHEVDPLSGRRDRGRLFWILLFVANMAGFVTAWHLVARSGVVNPIFLPGPLDVAGALREAFVTGELGKHLAFSSRNFAIGVGMATLVGIPLGLAAGSSRSFYRLVRPYVWAMASLPRVAWLPLLVVIFGYTNMSKLTLIFMAAVFPMIINSLAGVRSVDRSLLIAGRVFGAAWHQRYIYIIVPHAIPYIFSGFKQGLARSLAAVVVSEMFGGSQGLGYVMVLASKRFNSALLYAVLILIVIAALVIVRGIDLVENRVAPWRRQAAV